MTGLAEEFRLIKHQLLADIERQSKLPEERRRSVLICSAQPDDGQDLLRGQPRASPGRRERVEVLLVDGDFLKPDVLGHARHRQAARASSTRSPIPSVDPESLRHPHRRRRASRSCPPGAKTNNVPELLASDRSREVLAKLVAGDRRRIVLFNSPPALMASPRDRAGRPCRPALVVVRADQTTEADLRETIGLLRAASISLILNGAGLAVTGRKFGAYDGYGHED